jgi:membrane-bound metal-dependent hydrolase YbcI (DUF457 family)
MDPISHVAFGWTLIKAVGPREREAARRGIGAAVILGALSPDLDAVVMPFGWDRYLRVHEIGTHTIVGILVCGLLTAGLVRLFGRRDYKLLAACATIAAASHLLLDLLSSARLKPAWPLVDAVVSLPVVAMADPWLLVLCVAGAATTWMAGVRRRGPTVALVIIGVFVLAKGVLGALAFRSYAAARDRASEPVVARVIEAEWASLSGWRVFDRTAQRLRAWHVSSSGSAELRFSWPVEPDTPPVAASRSLSSVRNFLHAHNLAFAIPVAGTQVPAAGVAATEVLWSDVRFCWTVGADGAALEPMAESRERTRLACALWFGGELDATGRPLREIVKIGGFTQTRAPTY